MSITKPYFVHLITQQSESPALTGFKKPEPVMKIPQVVSAGWGNVKGDPNNRAMYRSLKPTTYEMLSHGDRRLKPSIDEELTDKPYWGPHIKEPSHEKHEPRYRTAAYENLPQEALPYELRHWDG